jgi:hypothetical protein
VDKVSPPRHDVMGHGWVPTNKPIESCSNNDKDRSKLLMNCYFLPELPAPDAKFYCSECMCGKDEAKKGAERDGEYGPEYLEARSVLYVCI